MKIDISDYIIKTVINQLDSEGWLRFIIFYSKKIISAELNYKIYNKELLTIIAVFKKWKIYLEGSIYFIKILTDYKNLFYFTITKKLNRRQTK